MTIYTLSIEILLAERIFFTTMQFLVIFLKSRLNQQVFLYFLDSHIEYGNNSRANCQMG